MIKEITYIESTQTNPYLNLAIEEYLLQSCREDECILYLWQNKQTVVIGYNQNAWKECLVSKLEGDGGHLARRLSGGGAVYHDDGNLNFTFLVRKENYSVDKQLQVIIQAAKMLGIHAEKSGRNDILADGKKFSGNAFYETKGHCYHHGTIMINVNLQELSKYLTVSKEKLQSKGVNSVKSRVANLSELQENVTIEGTKEKLQRAFEQVYGMPAAHRKVSDLNKDYIDEKKKEFESWDFIYGKKFEFQNELSHRFTWGEISIQFRVKEGQVQDVKIFSDSMHPGFIMDISSYFSGCRYRNKELCAKLGMYMSDKKQEEMMMKDIITWLEGEEL